MEINSAKRIEIEDKPLFDKYFKTYQPQNGEFTFTNLFMWRKYTGLKYMEWKDHLIMFSQDYLKKWKAPSSGAKDALYFFPPVGPNPAENMLSILAEIEGVEFHRVSGDLSLQLMNFPEFNKLKIEIVDDRDNWDYVYETEIMKTLPGNKHRQNRRWLNKFLENYEYELRFIDTKEMVEKTKELQLEWCIMRGCEDDEGLEQEQIAIYEALDHFEELGFRGILIGVNKECVAYTFGEMLNDDTIVIHIEKAHMEYEGAYQAIGNLFLKNCYQGAKYVNREQDLGIPGLRRAKESYKPHHMVEKNILFKKS